MMKSVIKPARTWRLLVRTDFFCFESGRHWELGMQGHLSLEIRGHGIHLIQIRP